MTTLLQRQRRQSVQWRMQDFVNGEAVPSPRSPKGRRTKSITQEFFQNSCVAIAVGKTETRRLISRIILASVVSASRSRCRHTMTDDSTTKNTRLLDREFIPKTEPLDLQFLFQQICDPHLTTQLSL